MKTTEPRIYRTPSLIMSLLPVAILLVSIAGVIFAWGAEAAQGISHYILLGVALITFLIARLVYRCPMRRLMIGFMKSAKQILPAVPILIFIATVAATWMLSGVVPTLIDYGLEIVSPKMFLFIACAVSACISVLSGSSWSTIATIGVAFMGIGTVLGYHPGWIAGAVISGGYFGDKVSPLSDTTVLASSTCGVELFTHIRYLMITSTPAMVIALIVYLVAGYFTDTADIEDTADMISSIQTTFNITPWTLLIPAITLALILCRIKTATTLAISSLLGVAGIFIFQPQILTSLADDGVRTIASDIASTVQILLTDTQIHTGDALLDSLVSTGGIKGMLPTIYLVLSAMTFGGMMMGSGMIATITKTFNTKLHSTKSIMGATVGSGLFLNSCTGDQYLSIIVGGNIYKNLYRRNGLEPRLLSRALEDSISVTSVLIPWNSCGVTQSTVLGVTTLVYLPYCIFNYMSPIMSLLMVWIGYKIYSLRKN